MKNIITSLLLLILMMIQVATAETSSLALKIELQELPINSAHGSMAPFIAKSESGITTINWLEPSNNGHALKFSKYNNGWGENKFIAFGDNWFINWADFPSLIHLKDSNYAAHWLVKSSSGRYAYDTYASMSNDDGNHWSEPVLVNQDGTFTEHGFASLYKDTDGLGLIYLDGRKMINKMTDNPNDTGMTLRAVNINLNQVITNEQLIDGLVCECCQPDIAISNSGPIGIYRNRTETEIRDIYITKKINGKWTPGKALYNDNWEISGCPVNGPSIHADYNKITIGWFTAANDKPVVKIAKSLDNGDTFDIPVEVGLKTAIGHVNITVDKNNNTWIIWHKKITNGAVALMLSLLEDETNKIREMTIDDSGNIPRYSVPQISNHNEEIIMAWTLKKNNETVIRSASFKAENF